MLYYEEHLKVEHLKGAVNKLDALGYIKNSADDWAINYAYCRSCDFIKAETNLSVIPEGLKTALIDLTVAEFLSYKKVSGELTFGDTEKAIKQIQEGDINIVYSDNESYDVILDKFIRAARDRAKCDILSYRRLKW